MSLRGSPLKGGYPRAAHYDTTPFDLLATDPSVCVVQPVQPFRVHTGVCTFKPPVPDVPNVLASLPRKAENTAMISFIDWFVPALIGLTFTLVGSLKLYGLSRGVVGGADKPFVKQLCGT
jgi:hypothetical protein